MNLRRRECSGDYHVAWYKPCQRIRLATRLSHGPMSRLEGGGGRGKCLSVVHVCEGATGRALADLLAGPLDPAPAATSAGAASQPGLLLPTAALPIHLAGPVLRASIAVSYEHVVDEVSIVGVSIYQWMCEGEKQESSALLVGKCHYVISGELAVSTQLALALVPAASTSASLQLAPQDPPPSCLPPVRHLRREQPSP